MEYSSLASIDRPSNIAVHALFRFLFQRTVKRGLRGVWVRGNLPPEPCVLAANHNYWWDTYVWPVLLWNQGRVMRGLMLDRSLEGFKFMRYGALPVSRPRLALRALQQGITLLVFPEGQLSPPGRLGALREGAAWLATKAGAPLVPAVSRIVLRGQEFAEAYVWIGERIAPDTARLEACLGQMLAQLDREIQSHDPEAPLSGFSLAIAGRKSTHERMAGYLGLLKPFMRG